MSTIIEERIDGSIAFSLSGDLQFDSRDEAIYHENLVLPAMTLALKRGLKHLRVLICGGGDGLALREVLRCPDVESVELVDLSDEVVQLGRTRFAELNNQAFEDPRVTVHIEDAWTYLERAGEFDVVIADFSVPRRSDEARVFSAEFYALVAGALSPLGVMAINSVSPQRTPAAFWCQVRSIRKSHLTAVPYRSCIPSFRDRGYGVWGVILGSKLPLASSVLRHLECPVPTKQTDLGRLWRGARFSRAERMLGRLVPVHSVDKPCLVDLLLSRAVDPELPEPWSNLPPPLRALFETLPVSHPYHTRLMVQTLADSVAGNLTRLQLGNLLDELLTRAARLPQRIVEELRQLKSSFGEWADWQNWSARILGALILVLTLANTLAPDHAFAKGAASFGHASMSRSGSFGRVGGFSSEGPVASVSIHGSGFQTSRLGGSFNGRPVVTDMEGDLFPSRTYYYYDSGYYGGRYGGYGYGNYGYQHDSGGPPPVESHTPVFVADDDVLVMDNGDIIVTLTPTAYMLLAGGHLQLMGTGQEPLLELACNYEMVDSLQKELKGRILNANAEAQLREDWLSWVNWTAAILPQTRNDKQELANLRALQKALELAQHKLKEPDDAGMQKPNDATLLFVGCLLFNNRIEFQLANGKTAIYQGENLVDSNGSVLAPAPAELKTVLKAVIAKLETDVHADLRSTTADELDLKNYRNQLMQWLQEYRSYYPDYMVDYGTSEIPAGTAVTLTNNDLAENQRLIEEDQRQAGQLTADLTRVQQAAEWFH